MPLFKYDAFSQNGKKVKGIIDASDLEFARFQLTKQELIIIGLKAVSETDFKHLSKKELLTFFQELSSLIKAGMPLYDSLLALAEKHQGQKMHTLLLNICDRVKEGHLLSTILALYPKSFDFLTCSMIANAEKSGALDRTLEEIASLLKKQLELKRQITSTLLYPTILSGFCLIVLATLFFFIIPSLSALFEGRALNPLTQFVVKFSQALNNSRDVIATCLLLIIGTIATLILTPSGKAKIHALTPHIPFLKKTLLKVAIVRFCRSFATLLNNGLPYIEALSLAIQVIKHRPLEKILEKAEKNIKEGKRLSAHLKEEPLIPPLVYRMLSIAEEGGNTSFMLQNIAQIYEGEIAKVLLQMTTILQPLMLLLLGLIIGFVVLCVLLPLTDVSSFLPGG